MTTRSTNVAAAAIDAAPTQTATRQLRWLVAAAILAVLFGAGLLWEQQRHSRTIGEQHHLALSFAQLAAAAHASAVDENLSASAEDDAAAAAAALSRLVEIAPGEIAQQAATQYLSAASGLRRGAVARAELAKLATQIEALDATAAKLGEQTARRAAWVAMQLLRGATGASADGSELAAQLNTLAVELRSAAGTAADTAQRDSMAAISTSCRSLASTLAQRLEAIAGAAAAGQTSTKAVATLLNAAAAQQPVGGGWLYVGLSGALALVLVCFVLMGQVYLRALNDRTAAIERQRRRSEEQQRANEAAILRLMNEMGDLADGDLTVNATVSEDITGAVADSINYTIEELRALISRVNGAASQVNEATQAAESISAQLLVATERQSRDIRETGSAVLKVAESVTEVSTHAAVSAKVAWQSLAAAEKGATAVHNVSSGMNDIRAQIQDTAKRLKRLGESSQEIGEIVELISDITEQTNVLALNAAIQAASAGEAGRGFAVVAEEVQRLAERSGEATKQIASIVRTIQSDTHDAVSAMERCTQGVVDGARLSDGAGAALSEIGDVTRQLTNLIESISNAAEMQADTARTVANNMRNILRATEQTTAGTKQSVQAIAQLSGLAEQLRGSVARFKV
jgi:twitching motility protein PilJ